MTLNNLELNNIKGLKNSVPVDIATKLIFNTGVVYTEELKPLRLTNSSQNLSDVTENFGDGRYIDGPVSKYIINNGGFDFPIGNDGRVGVLKVSNSDVVDNAYWTAQYFNSHPEPREESYFADNIKRLSDNEYWKVKCSQTVKQLFRFVGTIESYYFEFCNAIYTCAKSSVQFCNAILHMCKMSVQFCNAILHIGKFISKKLNINFPM